MKYLAIDIGNVICDVNFDNFTKKLSIALNKSEKEAFDILSRVQKNQDLGLSTIREELVYVHKLSDKSLSDLMLEWDETVKANHFIINELKNMLSENVQIALLSNMGYEHLSVIRNILTPDLYDNCIKFISCEVGSRKPTFLYYKTFIEMFPYFKNCVYIDDRIENIETALLFGFESYSFGLDTFDQEIEMQKKFIDIKNIIMSDI